MSGRPTDEAPGVRFASGSGTLLVDGDLVVLVADPGGVDGLVHELWSEMAGGSPRRTAGWLFQRNVDGFAVLGVEGEHPIAVCRGRVSLASPGSEADAVALPPPDGTPVEWPLAAAGVVRVAAGSAPVALGHQIEVGVVPAVAFELTIDGGSDPTPSDRMADPIPIPGSPDGDAGAEAEDDTEYDYLFGDATARPPTRGMPEVSAEAGGMIASAPHIVGSAAERPAAPESTAALVPPGQTGFAPPPDPPAPAPASASVGGPSADDGDHDGMTIASAQARALREEVPSVTQTTGTTTARRANAPTVHAVRCPSGHLNPPHAPVCRVCQAPVADQEHLSVPRPVLGHLRFSSGQRVELSRPLLIGRSPKAAGAITGEFPELVTVPSPQHDISRVHTEVRIEGWQVLVIDCGSTNGTVVTLPGRQPQLLRAGEPHPIVPGSSVTLGGEVTFWFEVAQ